MFFEYHHGETANERVSRCFLEAVEAGPMGGDCDGERYEDFLTVWERENQLRYVKTSCAVFASAVLGYCGKPLKKPWKADGTWGITTWLGLDFRHPSWQKAGPGVSPDPGDVFYRDAPRAVTNMGHVGGIVRREGELYVTAEGGGNLKPEETKGKSAEYVKKSNGRICRLSKPKDLFALDSLGRVPHGWWRVALLDLPETYRDELPTHPDGFLELRAGMTGPRVGEVQEWLIKLGAQLKSGADSKFGTIETEPAVRWFQTTRGMSSTGIVDRRTWDTLKAEAEK